MVSVQALRAIAALWVVLVHWDYVRAVLTNRTNELLPLYPLASGVDLFFAISGFIMVYSSERMFATDGGWRIFLTRRITRIVPLYWLATAVAIVAMAWPQDLQSFVCSILFIPHRTAAGTFWPVHAGGWTLNFEMFFYVIFSCALFLRRFAAVAAVSILLVLFVVLGRLFHPQFGPFVYWSDPIMLEFVFGMIIAMLREHYQIRLPGLWRLGLIILGCCAVWFSSPGGTIPSNERWIVWGIPVALILAGTTLGTEVDFRWFKRPVMFFGAASYAVYLFHPIVAAPTLHYWLDGTLTQFVTREALIMLGAITSIVIGIAVHWLVERRMLDLPRRYAKVIWSHYKIQRDGAMAAYTQATREFPESFQDSATPVVYLKIKTIPLEKADIR